MFEPVTEAGARALTAAVLAALPAAPAFPIEAAPAAATATTTAPIDPPRSPPPRTAARVNLTWRGGLRGVWNYFTFATARTARLASRAGLLPSALVDWATGDGAAARNPYVSVSLPPAGLDGATAASPNAAVAWTAAVAAEAHGTTVGEAAWRALTAPPPYVPAFGDEDERVIQAAVAAATETVAAAEASVSTSSSSRKSASASMSIKASGRAAADIAHAAAAGARVKAGLMLLAYIQGRSAFAAVPSAASVTATAAAAAAARGASAAAAAETAAAAVIAAAAAVTAGARVAAKSLVTADGHVAFEDDETLSADAAEWGAFAAARAHAVVAAAAAHACAQLRSDNNDSSSSSSSSSSSGDDSDALQSLCQHAEATGAAIVLQNSACSTAAAGQTGETVGDRGQQPEERSNSKAGTGAATPVHDEL